MEDKLRNMRVNMNQRKMLMAAGRFGIGPLVQMGMVKPEEYTPAASAASSGPPIPGGPSRNAPSAIPAGTLGGGRAQEQRREAWRKMHEDDGLGDLNAFLAPKRRPPISQPKAAAPAAAPAVASESGAGSGKRGEEKEVAVVPAVAAVAATKLEVRMAKREYLVQASPEVVLGPDVVRATASTAGARAKAASFKATQGPTVEEVRQLQLLHEAVSKALSTPVSAALEAAIEAIRDEELRRVKGEEKRRRAEWRKVWKEKKNQKKKQKESGKQQAEEEEDGDSDDSEGSSSAEKRRRLLEDGGLGSKNMEPEQKKFWGESVKGRVSNDNKGFTDADLEARFRAQQAASAGETLMTESQVLAMLKGTGKEKPKEKGKKKEKLKDRASSRERRR